MTKRQFSFPLLGLLILGLGVFGYYNFRKSQVKPTETVPVKPVAKINIAVTGVTEDLIPLEYTCEGEGVSPELTFSKPPKETKTLAVIVDDKDATLGVFTHWMLWNIDPETKTITRNETPIEATVGKNSKGSFDWSAICPPNGPMHHYRFKVYALSDSLDLPIETTKQTDLTKAMKNVLIGYGETVALFGK